MKNLFFVLLFFLIFLQSVLAIQTSEGHGQPLIIGGNIGGGQHSGVRIIVSNNLTLNNITKNGLTNGNTLYIYNDAGALLSSKQFYNNVATFSDGEVNLTKNQGYRLTLSNPGDWNHICLGSDPPLPVAGQYISWTNGLFPNQNALQNWQYFCNVESIGFSTDPPPQPPSLSLIGPKNVSENQLLTIQLEATDPNMNDTLTFLTNAQTVLPSSSFLNSTSGLFTWKPTSDDQEIYYVNFYVTDGRFIDFETVRIQAIDVNLATITITGNATIGNTLILNLNDPESANKQYILSASLGNSPGTLFSDGRVLQLNNDWLFNAVLYIPSLLGFTNSVGVLDDNGNAQVYWNIPSLSFFQTDIHFSFVTIDRSLSGWRAFKSVAQSVNVTIQ